MGYKPVGEELREAFERRHLDHINDLLFARIRIREIDPDEYPGEEWIVSLYDTGHGSLNMSEEEFYAELDKYCVEEGYGQDNVFGTVWLTNNRLFIRQEYDGWGHWTFVNPVPPEDIDPQGLWLE